MWQAATVRLGWKEACASLLLGLTLLGRRAPRRLTGQEKRDGTSRGPEPPLVPGAPSARRQVPQRPGAGSARRNAPHALPARDLAARQRRRAGSASAVRAR